MPSTPTLDRDVVNRIIALLRWEPSHANATYDRFIQCHPFITCTRDELEAAQSFLHETHDDGA